MMKLAIALLLSFAAFADPVITAIQPTSGPATGGTTVVVTGTDLRAKAVCLVPCPTRLAFGEVAVDVVEESDTRLVFVSPAHDPGTVDLTLYVTGANPVTVRNGFTFVAVPETPYERVLLPVYFEGVLPGAYGSQWRADFRIHNSGNVPATLAPWTCPPGRPCPAVVPLTYSLMPNQSLHNPADLDTDHRTNPSQILYIAKQPAPHVSMSLRIADQSRGTVNAGTEIPVIREGELLRDRTQLFDIPMDGQRYRVLVRLYEMTYAEANFLVRLYAQEGDAEPVHSAMLTAVTTRIGAFRTEAAYAQLDVTDLLNLRRTWPSSVRIEVVPQRPGSRYWAFASITNNDTQLVTLSTPQ